MASVGGRRAADLIAVAVVVVVTVAALNAPGVPWQVEWAVGVPFLLVLPGYAWLSVLWTGTGLRHPRDDGHGPAGRVALCLATSAVVVAVVGGALTTTVGLELWSATLGVGGVTLAGTALAAWRRLGRPASESPTADGSVSRARSVPDLSALQWTATAIAALALVGALTYAASAPSLGAGYSEFYLLEERPDGTLVATDYPSAFVAGENQSVYVAIENHEHRQTTYGVVVLAEAVETSGASTTVVDRQRVDQFARRVDAGERVVAERRLAPTAVGDRVRLQFLLYRGGVPDEPTVDGAALRLQLWVDVDSPPTGR